MLKSQRLAWLAAGVLLLNALGVAACRRSIQRETAVVPADAAAKAKIWDIDPVVGRERCEIHGTLLVDAIVPVVWGYAPGESFDRSFLGAVGEEFPHADDAFEGGCFPLEYTHARVKHCPQCVDARQRWLTSHQNVDASGRPRLTRR
jgi:hypothetical protein